MTAIRFGIAGAHAGQVLTKRVAVRVSDRDHLVAQAELAVQIHVIADVADDGLPPVCRVKPWLPECQR